MKKELGLRNGFTLMELMITAFIVSVIAAIAIPFYKNYTTKAYFSEVVTATAPYKHAVAECYQRTAQLTNCNAGSNGIPAKIAGGPGMVDEIDVISGVVYVVPNTKHGISASDTYELTPADSGTGSLNWTASGQAVTKGYTNNYQ